MSGPAIACEPGEAFVYVITFLAVGMATFLHMRVTIEQVDMDRAFMCAVDHVWCIE